MNTVPNRKAICDVLMEEAKKDTGIVVLCSDSRGSASLTPFADAFPGQFVDRNQRRDQLRCTRHESPFGSGYRRNVGDTQHEGLPAKRPFSDEETV